MSISICIVAEGVLLLCGEAPRIVKDIAGLALNTFAVCFWLSIADIAWRYLQGSRLLAYLTKQSFGIYLFHMLPIWLMRYWQLDEIPLYLTVPIQLIIAVAFSLVVVHLVRLCHLQVAIGEK